MNRHRIPTGLGECTLSWGHCFHPREHSWEWGACQAQGLRQGRGARGPPPDADSISPPPRVESNFSGYHQFLMQALVHLDSPDGRLKLTAMQFIGRCRPSPRLRGSHTSGPWGPLQRAVPSARRQPPVGSRLACRGATPPPSLHAGGILQDCFTGLCFCLKKGDVKTLKKRKHGATLSRAGTPHGASRLTLGGLCWLVSSLSLTHGQASILSLRTASRTGRDHPPRHTPHVGPGTGRDSLMDP